MKSAAASLAFAVASAQLAAAQFGISQYSATYTYASSAPSGLPDNTEKGQIGTNKCGSNSNENSLCQNAFINAVDDFCLWAPPFSNGQNATIGQTEEEEVAWCTKKGYGTRLIPDGTITGAHFVKTPDYVQITGVGDLTKMGIPANDGGGELDPHGATGNGNPVGGLVFTNAFSKDKSYEQIHEWTNFMAYNEFCFRACTGPNAAALCQHIYDEMGCDWVMPANYDPNVFETCEGDSNQPPGLYTVSGKVSTFSQGQPATPLAHPKPSSSNCNTVSSLSNGASYTVPGMAAASSGAAGGMTTVAGGAGAASTKAGSFGPAQTGSSTGSSSGSSGSQASTKNAATAGLAVDVKALSGFAVVVAGVVGACAVML